MRSGELATMATVSTDTLRHYERLGLLPKPARTLANYRDYPAQAVERLRIIRNALAVGFSLDEIGRILRVRDQGGAPCHEVRRMAGEKGRGDRAADRGADHISRSVAGRAGRVGRAAPHQFEAVMAGLLRWLGRPVV